ncbi:MAG: DUF4296 domain-containing protein [Flavobacteriales bacterium]|nr:DUF4296 domain-containing protein [Flavobacteriales bacterium]MCB9166706.1 DUF4296 domain-containing protein [Flavobacteriales bacterium]
MNRVLLFVLPLFVACATDRSDGSVELLDRETFTEVLAQTQLIEARNNREMVVEHRTDGPMAMYYDELFTDMGVTRDRFTATYDHYAARPDELKAIYEEVLTRLTRMKDTAGGSVAQGDTLDQGR